MTELSETHVRVFPIPHSAYTEPGYPGYGDETPWRWMAIVNVLRRGKGSDFRCRRSMTRRRAMQWAARVYAKARGLC